MVDLIAQVSNQQHLLYTSLDYLEVPWIYARPEQVCFAVFANSNATIIINKRQALKMGVDGKQLSWRAVQDYFIAPLATTALDIDLPANTVTITLRSKIPLQQLNADLNIFITEPKHYLQASWQLVCCSKAANILVNNVLIGSVQPLLECTVDDEYALLQQMQRCFVLPGSIAVKLSGFAKILWPDDCYELAVQFVLQRSAFWPEEVSLQDISLQTIILENISTITSEPWPSRENCNSYFVANSADCNIHSFKSINASNYVYNFQWQKHNRLNKHKFYAYPAPDRDGWLVQLEPLLSQDLVYSAEINVMPKLTTTTSAFALKNQDFSARFCGLQPSCQASSDLAAQLAWHMLKINSLQTLQQYLTFICTDPVLKTILHALYCFKVRYFYAHKPSSIIKVANVKVHLYKTGFTADVLYFFGFYLRLLLCKRLEASCILILQTEDCGRMLFAN